MNRHEERGEQARQQARAQLDFIVELMELARKACEGAKVTYDGGKVGLAELEERGRSWPLSVLVRSVWTSPGRNLEPAQYEILLSTGGPAVRLRGDLSIHGEPENVRMEAQDWFTSWERFPATGDEVSAMMDFAGLFWFGEGS